MPLYEKNFRLSIFYILPFFALRLCKSQCLFFDSRFEYRRENRPEIKRRSASFYNFTMQGGYFTMPSARMPKAGKMGLSFSSVPPYYLYAASFQFFDHLEFVGNYWIFRGITDWVLGAHGFGDEADRAANVKFSILRREDGFPGFPELAFGFNDFIGTKRFHSVYVVATQNILPWDLELTLGWGKGRIHGVFAGLAWSPLRKVSWKWIRNLSLCLEYDANDYKAHRYEHHEGRTVKNRFNIGLQYSLFDFFHFSASTLRGEKMAAMASASYNFGDSEGWFPKIYDPEPYTSPIDTQATGDLRSKESFAQELAYAFRDQGYDLDLVKWIPGEKEKLWLRVINVRYRQEDGVRSQIENLLSCLLPSNVSQVTVVVETDGLSVQEYTYQTRELARVQRRAIGKYELNIVSPMKEVSKVPSIYDAATLYERKNIIWSFLFRPMFRSYFGSARGKFKYDVGLVAGPQGYLWKQIYYQLTGSYVVKSSAKKVGSVDRINPSQIINVRTDTILYHQSNTFHVDKAYLQRSWNVGKGWFSRLALGYFETAYAGVAGEMLYYPVRANWAFGFEAAYLRKRKYQGMGFQNKIRKMKGFTPTYQKYRGVQYFLDFYYQLPILDVELEVSLGQFLAKDKGVKVLASRVFESGFTISAWYAATSAKDVVNGSRYFDKGVAFSIPLDFFMNKSSKSKVGYGMAAWLRDIAAKAETGKELYPIIHGERLDPEPVRY